MYLRSKGVCFKQYLRQARVHIDFKILRKSHLLIAGVSRNLELHHVFDFPDAAFIQGLLAVIMCLCGVSIP